MLLVSLLLIACQKPKVKVEISASGGQASRTFATNSTDRASLEAAAAAYGSEGTADAELGRKFTGTFAESALPSEIGNHGALGSLDSSLGSSRVYYEQFAPRRSEWEAMHDRVESGVLWMKLFGRYIETRQLKDEAARTRFSQWWNGEVIPLVPDLYLMYSGMQAAIQAQRIGVMPRGKSDFHSRTPDEEFSIRVFEPLAILLAERGWITADELAAGQMLALNGHASGREREWFMRSVVTPLIKRTSAQFDQGGEGLSTTRLLAIGVDFMLWVQMSTQYRDILLASPAIPESTKESLRKGVWNVELPPPFGIQVHSKAVVTDAEVVLDTGAEPFLTNGRWNAESKKVEFRGGFYESKFRYTTYNPPYYALWSLPTQRQESVFGEVILQGESLAEYCVWEAALAETVLEDTLLATDGPAASPLSDSPPSDSPTDSLADSLMQNLAASCVKGQWLAALERLARTKDVAPALALIEQLKSTHPAPSVLTDWLQRYAASATVGE